MSSNLYQGMSPLNGINYSSQAPMMNSNLPFIPNSPYANVSSLQSPVPPPRIPNYSNSNQYSFNNRSYLNRPMYNNNMYSPYNQPYTPYHLNNDLSLINQAHESCAGAFTSIESVVNTFGSINMMIESTYCALKNTFHAVMSVAENISRLKSQFGQIMSAFTIIRTFQWLYRRLLYLLGLRSTNPSSEFAWQQASETLSSPLPTEKTRASLFSRAAMFIAVYGAPFLMWKLVSALLQQDKIANNGWMTDTTGQYLYANVKFDYTAQREDELSLRKDAVLRLAPSERQTDSSWLLATDGKTSGLVPINFLNIQAKPSRPSTAQTTTAEQDCTKDPKCQDLS